MSALLKISSIEGQKDLDTWNLQPSRGLNELLPTVDRAWEVEASESAWQILVRKLSPTSRLPCSS